MIANLLILLLTIYIQAHQPQVKTYIVAQPADVFIIQVSGSITTMCQVTEADQYSDGWIIINQEVEQTCEGVRQ